MQSLRSATVGTSNSRNLQHREITMNLEASEKEIVYLSKLKGRACSSSPQTPLEL